MITPRIITQTRDCQVFRGSRVMVWRDVRLNKVAQHVFLRQEMEFQERLDGGRARYQHLVDEAGRWVFIPL